MSNKKMRTTIVKKVKAIVVLLMLLISVVYFVPYGFAQDGGGLPRIMVVPERIVDPKLKPGDNFNISICTDYNGLDVHAYEFTLNYDPNILHGGIKKKQWDIWTGDNVTRTFNTTLKPVVLDSEEVKVDETLMTRIKSITDIWVGDNVTKSFITTLKPVVLDSEMVYVNKSFSVRDLDYIIDYDTGNITFATPPEAGVEVKAEYQHGHYSIVYRTGTITFATAPGSGAEVKARYFYNRVVNGDLITADEHDQHIYPPGLPNCTASFVAGKFNNTEGTLSETDCVFQGKGEIAKGPGILANITFTVVGYGASAITLGPSTRLAGWDIFQRKEYYIIDAELQPDQIQHGFFANVRSGSSAGGGATTEAKAYFEIANELEEQSEGSFFTLHIAVPEVTLGWSPCWKARGIDTGKPGERWVIHWETAFAIGDDLAKIGINVVYHWIDKDTWWDLITDADHKKTYDEGGWDMALLGWDAMPTDLLGYEGMYSGRCPCYPDGGNYFDWNNEAADFLLERGMSEFDPMSRKMYLELWQEEFMHDPPAIILNYLETWDLTTAYLEGWDPVVGWADGWNLRINATLFDALAPTRRKQIGSNTLLWGSNDRLESLNPLMAWSEADFVYAAQAFETLMKLEKDSETGGYKVVPWLANGPPIYSADGKNVTVYLRNDVLWQDAHHYLNNIDVESTFEALIKFGWRPYADVIESIEADTTGDPLKVVFHLNKAYPAFDSLLSQTPILPHHFLVSLKNKYGYDWYKWWIDETNWNPNKRIPGTGPFKLLGTFDDRWEMAANTEYWKWTGEPMIDRILGLYRTQDPESNFIGLKWHEFDFGDCWATSGDVMQWIINENGTLYGLKALDDHTPTLDYLAFNLNHDKLSNRYVRQAIAHAINYANIRDSIIEPYPYNAYPGKAPIFRIQQYTGPNGQTVRFFDEHLPPYEYSITKAQQYLNMWYYSQAGEDYTKGPMGDADFSGWVRTADFPIWVDNLGTKPADWTILPGNDIDPDHDNDGRVDLDDFFLWRNNLGKQYPFPGAR